jgi:hypothetical protein
VPARGLEPRHEQLLRLRPLPFWLYGQNWCTTGDLNSEPLRSGRSASTSWASRAWCSLGESDPGARLTKAVDCHWPKRACAESRSPVIPLLGRLHGSWLSRLSAGLDVLVSTLLEDPRGGESVLSARRRGPCGPPEGIRTHVSLFLVPAAGIKPATSAVQRRRSTTELNRRNYGAASVARTPRLRLTKSALYPMS